MNQEKQIEALRKECYDLFKFREDPAEYEKAVYKLDQTITKLGINHLVDPLELSFWLLQFNLLSFPKKFNSFKRHVDRILSVKKVYFFFQIPQLVGFPDNYNLGHGKLRAFISLPRIVRDFAVGLATGKVGEVKTEQERIHTVLIREVCIPFNPSLGCWLEICTSGISEFIIQEKVLQAAEESLDILRILRSHIKISLPQYAISKNQKSQKARFNPLRIELYKYHFDPKEKKLIDRLTTLAVNPRFDLEKRVLNALQFYRIGRNSPEDKELFYYVAAMENLLLDQNDRDVLRWKFSEKAAFLLNNDLDMRLETVKRFKTLYDARSTIAHGNVATVEYRKNQLARDCLLDIIVEILELIDKKGLKTLSSEGKNESLDEYIDQIKYSGKPLR